jgi:hypothetical protein
MKLEINEILQWSGAVFIIAGHSLNAVGPEAYPYNILAFFVGTVLFMAWTIRVANKPQFMVNVVAPADRSKWFVQSIWLTNNSQFVIIVTYKAKRIPK